MFSKSLSAMFSAVRLLFKRWRVLLLLVMAWAGLIAAVYLFASTREATIFQLVLTLVVVVAAPALFFVMQSVSVSYTDGSDSRVRKTAIDGFKIVVVSLPVVAVTLLAIYGLSKVQTYVTLATTMRYLLIAVVAPMLAIQLWIASTSSGLRELIKSLRGVLSRTFAPQSVFVYGCGFVIFAVVPYLLLQIGPRIERPWLELAVLVLRLAVSAILILLGWVTTLGAISILNRTR